MAYTSWSVVFGEQPSAAKWNILGSNDASFNDGSGIGNGTITPSKLDLDPATANVATSQTTTSTSMTDLATVGPAVTVTVGANGLALVTIGCGITNSNSGSAARMGYAVSGATTVAADNNDSFATTSAQITRASWTRLVTGLNTGSTTFTAKYSVSGNTGTFDNRWITAIPL